MRQSKKLQRWERHHRRNTKKSSINLVSLMDIFTILVFFLLVNSGDVQVLPTAKQMSLPESSFEQNPQETLVVSVNPSHISVSGKQIVSTTEVENSVSDTIPSLKKYLVSLSADNDRTRPLKPEEKVKEITIMGDQSIPYVVLKKVMNTCAKSDYNNVYLAVKKQLDSSQGVASL